MSTQTQPVFGAERASGPPRRSRILVLDDDEGVRNLLRWVLTRNDYDVTLAADGNTGLDSAVDQTPDLVILDLGLPGLSGMAVCKELRSWLPAPILVLSGRDEEPTKIQALDLGADDYLTKPFRPGELLARIRALLRRNGTVPSVLPALQFGDLVIDLARRQVQRAGCEITLTRTEFNILACLAQHVNRVISATDILLTVWGHDNESDTQTLRVHVAHLRRKLGLSPEDPSYIRTVPGVGYAFSVRQEQGQAE